MIQLTFLIYLGLLLSGMKINQLCFWKVLLKVSCDVLLGFSNSGTNSMKKWGFECVILCCEGFHPKGGSPNLLLVRYHYLEEEPVGHHQVGKPSHLIITHPKSLLNFTTPQSKNLQLSLKLSPLLTPKSKLKETWQATLQDHIWSAIYQQLVDWFWEL